MTTPPDPDATGSQAVARRLGWEMLERGRWTHPKRGEIVCEGSSARWVWYAPDGDSRVFRRLWQAVTAIEEGLNAD